MTATFGASMDIRFECTFGRFIEFLSERGLSHIELRQGYLDVHRDAPSPVEVRNAQSRSNITVTYHAPFQDCNLANTHEDLRRSAVEAVNNSLDAAAAAGAGAVVVHGGTLRPQYPERVRDLGREAAVTSLRECSRHADAVGVPLCIENQRETTTKHRLTAYPERFAALLDDVAAAAPRPSITFDVGHAKATGVEISDFIDTFGEEIKVAHLHTNDGTEDTHDPLPEFREVAKPIEAEFNVLEMKSLSDIERCVQPVHGP